MSPYKILLAVFVLCISLTSSAYEYSLAIDLKNGTDYCSYQYDYKSNQKVNICSTQKDARCLWDFNVDVTLYNLREHYGDGQRFFCEATDEFAKEVLNMTALKDTGFDP